MLNYIQNPRWKFYIGVIVVPLILVYIYQTTMNAWQFQHDYEAMYDSCAGLKLERAQAACFVSLYAHGPEIAQKVNYSAIEDWPACQERMDTCGIYNCTDSNALSSVLVLGHCLLEASFTSTCYVGDCTLAFPDIKRAQDMCRDVVMKSQTRCVDQAVESEAWLDQVVEEAEAWLDDEL